MYHMFSTMGCSSQLRLSCIASTSFSASKGNSVDCTCEAPGDFYIDRKFGQLHWAKSEENKTAGKRANGGSVIGDGLCTDP